jgi:DNA-binding response OmpR family regulator
MRLLLVEDDAMIGETVLDLLRQQGHAVDWVRTLALADQEVQSQAYDAILLDLGLPDGDGVEGLRRWRARGVDTPVLIATARDALPQRVAGLDAGADDYVVKPYEIDEILARLRALVRRSHGHHEGVYEHQGVTLDVVHREALVQGEPVVLSGREWAVLEALLAHPGMILSRAQLEEKIYDWKRDISSNAVEVYVHGLRKKLGPGLIQNARGLGYWVPKP